MGVKWRTIVQLSWRSGIDNSMNGHMTARDKDRAMDCVGTPSDDVAVNAWLAHALSSAFGETRHLPLPAELLNLLPLQ